ncbi:MAG: hypothetical protein IPO23_13185 [Flavobacterium sp.]|nr:hypothetical protein [Flavobacterium sp.]
MKFRIAGEAEDSEPNEKIISLVVNADPKSYGKTYQAMKAKMKNGKKRIIGNLIIQKSLSLRR